MIVMETKDFQVKAPEDVAKFFFWLVFDCRLNFHPDDRFDNYVSIENGQQTFTDEQCAKYDKVMDDCFEVCEKHNRDIYEIASRVIALFYYCDGNDYLANI